MALEIVWTPQAEKGLDKVLEYLQEEWSAKEIFVLEKRIIDLMSVSRNIQKSARHPENIRTSAKD